MIGAPVYVCNVSSDESEEYLDVSPDENEETLLDLPVMNWGGAEGSTAHNNVENEDEEHLDLQVMNYGNANERRVANRQSEEHLDLPPIW